MKNLAYLGYTALALIISSCGQSSTPVNNIETSQSNNQINTQQITFCQLRIDYPHKSSTIPTEADVKGQINCSRELSNIRKGGSIYLYYRPKGQTAWTLVNARSFAGTVGYDGLKLNLIAAGPCRNGEYYGVAEQYGLTLQDPTFPIDDRKVSPIASVTNC